MRILLSGMLGHMGKEVVNLLESGFRGMELAAGLDASVKSIKDDKANEVVNNTCSDKNDEIAANACTDRSSRKASDVCTNQASQASSSACAKKDSHAVIIGNVNCYAEFSQVPVKELGIDCIVDFSHHAATKDLTDFAVANRLPLVLATTGQTDEELAMIHAASKEIPLFFAANYSVGIAILIELAKKTAALMPDAEVEIVEMHHDRKLDAPSGTALAIARGVSSVRNNAPITTGRSGLGKRTKEEIGVQAVRMGNIVGIHEVLIGTNNQTITLKHEAHSRALFAEGALAAADFMAGKAPGLYDMTHMVSMK